jgi:hypothetical protein
MADIKGTLQEAGNRVSETATKVGNRISEGVEQAADWAKQKAHQVGNRAEEMAEKGKHAAQEACGSGGCSTASIKEHMEVVGSCGNKLGVVDHLDGDRIKLTRNDSPDGQHHFIPSSWVSRVDSRVHLSKDCGAARSEWASA